MKVYFAIVIGLVAVALAVLPVLCVVFAPDVSNVGLAFLLSIGLFGIGSAKELAEKILKEISKKG